MARSPEKSSGNHKSSTSKKKSEKEKEKSEERQNNLQQNNGLTKSQTDLSFNNLQQQNLMQMKNQMFNKQFPQQGIPGIVAPNLLFNGNKMGIAPMNIMNNEQKQLSNPDLFNFPPQNQAEYRSVVIDYLLSELFEYPIHSSDLQKKIVSIYEKKIKNINQIINYYELQIHPILQELKDKSSIQLEFYCVGTRQESFILDINVEKLKQLSREFFKDRPKSIPSIPTDAMKNNNLKLNNFNITALNPNPNNLLNFVQPAAVPNKKGSFQQQEIDNLLQTKIGKEKIIMEQSEEMSNLMNKQSAEENQLIAKFKNQGAKIDFCTYGTKDKCRLNNKGNCQKAHFRKVIQPHTEESLGNCSYLDTCRHLDYCKFIHYQLDIDKNDKDNNDQQQQNVKDEDLLPHERGIQWVECDIREMDFRSLGKFDIIMADPPWDIHMNLPYETMKDKEMKALRFDLLQDDGLIFLWVTGRAMELARECMQIWGYKRVEELIWVKTNQLQRIIRTGRTGHWLNHSKEHCLVGIKGNPKINANIDCDVIVTEVRETSRKPDEIYHLLNRLSPKGRKIELFGRPHNCSKGWMTLGNQLPGVYFLEPDIIELFKKRYPEIDCSHEKMEENKAKFNSENEINAIYGSHIQNNNPPFKITK